MTAASLADYLAAAGRQRFAWGVTDCWTFGFDWVQAVTGVDALGAFRGAYASAREQRAIVKRHGGGTREFTDDRLFPLGYVHTLNADPGDVGVVWTAWKEFHGRTVFIHTTAICVRPHLWAMKPLDGGIVLAGFPVFCAWTLSHGSSHRRARALGGGA